ncbi:MAG: RNA polymerase sigma factor [Armatimonadetes bacterium]|nr:RNA polymerase sigma factor [Armatimonadota bacterium]MBS1726376.1 RNA polymerase sigma factor [Armatimonadota bacterium]
MSNDRSRIAFDLFYAEHASPAYRFALRLCGNRDDAEDLAAEAFAKAFRRWSQYRGDAAARSWLFAIILNEWKMACRKQKPPQDSLERASQLAQTLQLPDVDLARAILALPENNRVAFLLVKGEGLSHAEAAKVMRVPVGTMYFRVHRAVTQLRALLDDPADETEIPQEVTYQHEM